MKVIYNQVGFLEGLSARFDQLRPADKSYPLLINGRVRENAIEPIRSPVEDEQIPSGTYQNLTAVGSVLLCFVSGQVYYRDVETSNGWAAVTGVSFDNSADIDTEVIPASTLNYKRAGAADSVYFNNSPARSTPEAIIATDGVTQPSILYPALNGAIAGRVTFTYDEWTETEDGLLREYVPIGRFPTFVGQKLYMAIKGSTNVLNRIAQSVSGRPLDFVMAIDEDTGDKAGNALTTAHAVGYDIITGMFGTSFDDGSFIVGTQRAVTGVTPNQSSLFFGEPRLRNTPLFRVGLLNQKSIVDLNGDAGFLTPAGVHSFNATMQKLTESQNDPIAVQIKRLIAPPFTYGCTAEIDDYALFAVETIYGPGIIVFDKTLDKFVAIDLLAGIGQIKQFARTVSSNGQRLFFITNDNQLFEYGAADTRETCRFYMGDWTTSVGRVIQTFGRASFVFSNVVEDTTVKVTQFGDRVQVGFATFELAAGVVSDAPIIPLPFARSAGAATGVVDYAPTEPKNCFGAGVMVAWNTAAKLVFATLECDADTRTPSSMSQAYIPAERIAAPYKRFALAGDFDAAQTPLALFKLPTDYTVIGLGDFFYSADHAADYAEYAGSFTKLRTAGRLYATPGNHDFDYDGGQKFMQTYGNGQLQRSFVIGEVEWFFINPGWDTADLGSSNPVREPMGNTVGRQQYNWLKGALAASTARWKFVCMHEGPYSSSTYSPGYSVLRWDFQALGADAVFCAHDHVYQRHIIDGFNYICVGTGGRPLGEISATPIAGFQTGRAALGYLNLVVDHYDAEISHVGLDGTVFDRFVIHR